MLVEVLFLMSEDGISVVSMLMDGVDETYSSSYAVVEKDLAELGLTITKDAHLFHANENGMYFEQVWSA